MCALKINFYFGFLAFFSKLDVHELAEVSDTCVCVWSEMSRGCWLGVMGTVSTAKVLLKSLLGISA